VFTPDRFSI